MDLQGCCFKLASEQPYFNSVYFFVNVFVGCVNSRLSWGHD